MIEREGFHNSAADVEPGEVGAVFAAERPQDEPSHPFLDYDMPVLPVFGLRHAEEIEIALDGR